jgi:hypothetical protein
MIKFKDININFGTYFSLCDMELLNSFQIMFKEEC